MPEKKVYYLTKQGLKDLKQEYQELQEIKRLKSTEEKPKSFSSFTKINVQYFLIDDEESRALNDRLLEIEKILKYAELIKESRRQKLKKVILGATVLIESEDATDEFTIVGSTEANPSLGKISNESPLGQSLLGKKVNEIVKINSPEQIVYRIKKISYKKIK